MKISHFADIHISDSRIQEFDKILDQLGSSIKKEDPDLIVFSGDMFVHRDKLSPKQVQLTRQFFKYTLRDYRIIIIPGNHDISMSEIKIDSLSAIFMHDSSIKIYTEVGEYLDISDHRIHMFGYPSKTELVRLGIVDVTQVYKNEELLDKFELDDSKKNILLYHGVLAEFSISGEYIASEEAINVGKDLVIDKTFWGKFDAVMAGHLHKYQQIDNAVYPGCPVPLTFADSGNTGWILWEDLDPKFISLPQLYPYQTIDVGDISVYKQELTQEAVRRLTNNLDYTDTRIRIKYKINQSQTGEVNHTRLSANFKNALDIKIVPSIIPMINNKVYDVSLDDYQHHNVETVILKYIDDKKYNPEMKKIAKLVENRLKARYSTEEEKGINFSPSKLRMSNFKCFGEDVPELDFSKLSPVVGIFGKNKTGKSSLVEAIVWALFGTTIRNKDVKSVVRNGQKQCKVELEFYSHNMEYKIVRVRNVLAGAGLVLSRRIDGAWVDISGADVKATQVVMEELVGTFDIFISTIYSPQNNINLLVMKKPAERKKIIMDCLQIDVLSRRLSEINDVKKEVKSRIDITNGKINAYTDQVSRLLRGSPEELLVEFQNLLANEKIIQARYLTHIESLSQKLHSYDDLKGEYEELNTKIVSYREEIEESRLKLMTKGKEQTKIEGLLADKSVLDRGLQRMRTYEVEYKRYTDEAARNIERNSKVTQLKQELEKRENDHSKTVGFISASSESITNQIEGKTSLDCPQPICPINAEIQKQKDELRIELDNITESIQNIIKENEIEVNNLKEQIITAEGFVEKSFYDKAAHMDALRGFNEEKNNKWEELEHKLSSGVSMLESIMELVAAYERQLADLRQRRDEAVAKRSGIANKVATISGYESELAHTRLDLSECNKKVTTYETQIHKNQQNIQTIADLQIEIGATNTRLKKIEEYLVHCIKYGDIVGKNGVIFNIVDKAIPIIEKFAQELLAATTNGAISVSLDSHKALSGGGTKDEVSIFISDAKGTRDVLEASGSETVLVSLALRAAMANLLSMRMGSCVELFIIDEGMGALDDEGIVTVKSMFKALGKDFKKVLVITHVAELKDVAQTIVEVESNSITSTFKVIEEDNV